MSLDSQELEKVVRSVVAIDLKDLIEGREAAKAMFEDTPEGHWMRGLIGISLESLDALIAYRKRLEEIGENLVAGLEANAVPPIPPHPGSPGSGGVAI